MSPGPKFVIIIMKLLLSLAALLTLLGLSGGSWYLWAPTPPALVPSGKYIVVAALLLAVAGLVLKRRRLTLADFGDPIVWTGGLVAIFLSAWLCRPYSYFQGPEFRTEIVIAGLGAAALSYTCWRRFFIALPILASALSIWTFLSQSGGAILFGDDHAMFIFRLKLLKEHFPSIPFWSPVWNGGIDARDFFATGALNAFLLASPLVYLFPVESVYNIIIAGFLFVLAPLSSYLAARRCDAEKPVAAIAALLAMSSSLFWYRWALKYGTVGFIVSSSLMPLTIALFIRFISKTTLQWREVVGLVACTTLMLLWSPSGIALLPLGLIALPKVRRIFTERRHIITIILLIALNLPWMAMMWKVSSVGRFLNSDSPTQNTQTVTDSATTKSSAPESATYRHRPEGLNLKKSLKNWQESVGSASPLFVVLAIPAIIALTRPYRLVYGAVCLWLVTLGTVGVSLKPQLELDRMLVVAGLLSSFPIALFIVRMFHESSRGLRYRAAAIICGAFMLASPFATRQMLQNQLYDKYYFAGPEVQELSTTISSLSKGGRGLFTGCVLHQLSEGHLAPLPFWSETPLIASSYAHNIWKYEQPIPASFLQQGDAGITRYFDLMNVTVVMAHEPEWRRYFMERPTLYAERSREKDFMVFERIGVTPSYVLEGDAKDVTQTHHSASLTPLSQRVVLKFKHFPFLRSSGCKLSAYPVAPELSLVELSECRIGEPITIESISPMQRLMM